MNHSTCIALPAAVLATVLTLGALSPSVPVAHAEPTPRITPTTALVTQAPLPPVTLAPIVVTPDPTDG